MKGVYSEVSVPVREVRGSASKGKGHSMTCQCRYKGIFLIHSQFRCYNRMDGYHRATTVLTPQENPVSIVYEAGWAYKVTCRFELDIGLGTTGGVVEFGSTMGRKVLVKHRDIL